MNIRDAQFLDFTRKLQLTARQSEQIAAVAEAIGCPEWTTPEGCNRTGECFCSTAARRVAEIEREKVTA